MVFITFLKQRNVFRSCVLILVVIWKFPSLLAKIEIFSWTLLCTLLRTFLFLTLIAKLLNIIKTMQIGLWLLLSLGYTTCIIIIFSLANLTAIKACIFIGHFGQSWPIISCSIMIVQILLWWIIHHVLTLIWWSQIFRFI